MLPEMDAHGTLHKGSPATFTLGASCNGWLQGSLLVAAGMLPSDRNWTPRLLQFTKLWARS